MGKKKKYADDDGRTVANMNIPGIRGYRASTDKKDEQPNPQNELTKKERRALIFGAYRAALPYFLSFLGGLVIIALLLFLWLN